MTPIGADLTDKRRPGKPRAASRAPLPRQSVPERRNQESREQLIGRIRAEFDELRGLNLTLAQASRLFGLREDISFRVLNALIGEGLLQVTPDHLFERRRTDV